MSHTASLLYSVLGWALVVSFPSDTPRNFPPGQLREPQKHLQLEKDAGSIEGYFECRGVESGGKEYKGIVGITKKGEVYIIQWMVGTSTFAGIGIRQGSNFSASWTMSGEKGLVRGINQYRIEPGPRLVGRWATLPGSGVMQSETLTFLKAMDEEE